ncbi:MAG: protein translocase subunit SecF [Pseudomonadota bacterium]
MQVKDRLASTFGPTWLAEERFDAEVGARMTIEYSGEVVPLDQIRAALVGVQGIEVQEGSDDNVFYVKLPGLATKVEQAIEQSLEGKKFQTLQVDSVGPKVGGDLRRQGFISVFATLALVLVYVGFRFDMAFAPGAVICLFHDVAIVVGVFVILQRELNVSFIGALLTIVGYSLNDTIVVYDRIRENMERYRRKDLPVLINTSINETLNRTLNTSLTTVLAMFVFLFMGGPVIEDFALAIILGVFVGTYSSVYVASPIILVMQDVKPWLFKLMTRSQRSSPEQAAGAEAAESGRARHGELVQKDGTPDGKPDGKPKSERDLFRDL